MNKVLSYKRSLDPRVLRKTGTAHVLDYLLGNEKFFMSSSGRGGLEYCIEALKFRPDDIVLLPVFVAEGVISPFRKKNIGVEFYKCKPDMVVDLEDLKAKFETMKNVKAVVVIHYFGFPQDLGPIKALCEKHDVILFEDCAQSLFSRDDNGVLLGSTGDISFFSLAKTVPVADGAVFYVNNPSYDFLVESPFQCRTSFHYQLAIAFHLLFLMGKHYQLRISTNSISRISDLLLGGLYFSYYQFLRKMEKPQTLSNISKRILGNLDYKHLIERKSANAALVYENLDRDAYSFVYPAYNRNFILTGVPLFSDERDELLGRLRKKGIQCLKYVHSWNFIPQKREKEFLNEKNFLKSHFLIPVSENIDEKGMTYLVDTMNNELNK